MTATVAGGQSGFAGEDDGSGDVGRHALLHAVLGIAAQRDRPKALAQATDEGHGAPRCTALSALRHETADEAGSGGVRLQIDLVRTCVPAARSA
ncbi:hypothetical protein ACFWR9_33100 [Streptomyces sp. NPDC058534]|uniref:hypothetical protein n=1 Tax=Streptomyces sp. NPDC058534 TaxID=3346541 RepID=UPI00364FC1B3